jgi:hypothetical protein
LPFGRDRAPDFVSHLGQTIGSRRIRCFVPGVARKVSRCNSIWALTQLRAVVIRNSARPRDGVSRKPVATTWITIVTQVVAVQCPAMRAKGGRTAGTATRSRCEINRRSGYQRQHRKRAHRVAIPPESPHPTPSARRSTSSSTRAPLRWLRRIPGSQAPVSTKRHPLTLA